MTRLSDSDLTKESIQVQEFSDEVKRIINNGLYEIQVTAASAPTFDAPQEPTLVFSVFGAQYRLYIGYLGVWYYITATAL
jgi:DNA-binding IclR family transcriptional regulator